MMMPELGLTSGSDRELVLRRLEARHLDFIEAISDLENARRACALRLGAGLVSKHRAATAAADYAASAKIEVDHRFNELLGQIRGRVKRGLSSKDSLQEKGGSDLLGIGLRPVPPSVSKPLSSRSVLGSFRRRGK